MHVKIIGSLNWLTVRNNFLGCKVVQKCSDLSSSKRHPWKHPDRDWIKQVVSWKELIV